MRNPKTMVLGGLLLACAPHVAAQIPDKFTNLDVLPKDIGRGELVGFMREYASALGVRCIHCHVGEDPNSLDHVDFASDEREPKRVARAMMRMVQQINGTLLPATGRSMLLEVDCHTCHHGLTRPRALRDVLAEEIENHGTDAGIARYRELREVYYGRDAYDFGPPTLNDLAEKLARQRRDATAAIALVRVNLEFHPDSDDTHFLLAGLLRASGDSAGAIASVRHALELSPGNSRYERALKQLEAPQPPNGKP